MAHLSRRGFIRNTSVGAAVLGAAAAAPGLVSAEQAPRFVGAETALAGSTPLMAHVRSIAGGEIALYVGTREVIVHDPALVRRLVKAVQQAQPGATSR